MQTMRLRPRSRSAGHADDNTLAACQTKNVNSASAATSAPIATAPGEPVDIAANAMKFSGTSSVAIRRIPRLVVGSFQRCSLYKPTPNSRGSHCGEERKLEDRALRNFAPEADDQRD